MLRPLAVSIAASVSVILSVAAVTAGAAPLPAKAPAAPASVASAEALPAGDELPELNRHRFLQTSLIGQPFITDLVGMSFAFGSASHKQEAQPDQDQADLNFVGPSPILEAQLGIASRVAVGARVQAVILAATDTDTAALMAESAQLSAKPGFIVRLLKTDAQMLSLTGDFAYERGFLLSPATALDIAARTQRVALDTLLVKTRTYTYSPGLRYAAGIFDMLGVTAESTVDFEDFKAAEKESITSTTLRAGAALSFDLYPRTPVPVGFVAAYVHGFGLTETAGKSDAFTAGIYGTASAKFKPGLEAQADWRDAARVYSGMVSMRYYF